MDYILSSVSARLTGMLFEVVIKTMCVFKVISFEVFFLKLIIKGVFRVAATKRVFKICDSDRSILAHFSVKSQSSSIITRLKLCFTSVRVTHLKKSVLPFLYAFYFFSIEWLLEPFWDNYMILPLLKHGWCGFCGFPVWQYNIVGPLPSGTILGFH